MKFGTAIAVMGLVASANAAEPVVNKQPGAEIMGGSSSNGGGGVQKESNFIPFGGLGELIASGKGPTYEGLLNGFIEAHPTVAIHTCPGFFSRPRYPELPDEYKDKFSIELLASPSIWEKIGFTKTPAPEAFSETKVCSEDDMAERYGRFVLVLYQILEADEIGRYLIQKSFEMENQKLNVVVTTRTKEFEAVGGALTEVTWFDRDSGRVFWGPLDRCKGLACWTNRSEYSYFRHEFTHLLLYRALGENYPNEKTWHDIRFVKLQDWDQNYSKVKTSVNAAYIEGIANAMENGTSIDHPYILSRGNFNNLYKNCYWDMKGMRLTPAGFAVPTWSETYVGSTINALFRKWQPQSWVKESNLERSDYYGNFIEYTTHTERMKEMIDAIVTYGPATVVELAVAYDEQTGSDLGLRWFREYYMTDYKTGKNIANQYSYKTAGDRQTVCFSEEDSKNFLEFTLQKEEDEVTEAAKKMFAEHVSKQTLLDNIKNNPLKIADAMVGVEYISRKHALSHQFQLCELQGEERRKKAYDLADDLQVKYHMNYIAMMHIGQVLEEGCVDQSSTMAKYVVLKMQKQELEAKIAETTEEDLDQHSKNIQDWLQIKKQTIDLHHRIQDELTILSNLEGGNKH